MEWNTKVTGTNFPFILQMAVQVNNKSVLYISHKDDIKWQYRSSYILSFFLWIKLFVPLKISQY